MGKLGNTPLDIVFLELMDRIEADEEKGMTADGLVDSDELLDRIFNRVRDLQANRDAGVANGYKEFEGTMEDSIAQMAEKASEMDENLRSHPNYRFLDKLTEMWSSSDPTLASYINPPKEQKVVTFESIKVKEKDVQIVHDEALQLSVVGEIADYIPGLASVVDEGTADKTAIVAIDADGNVFRTGDALGVRFTAQSDIKPILYLYALYQGMKPREIANAEPTGRNFNDDTIFDLWRSDTVAGHSQDNAGGISSSGAIKNFNDFLHFMRVLTGNTNLTVDEDVFASEKRTSGGNRGITHMLERGSRFTSERRADAAFDNYTRACSINVTAEELARAYQVIASGGKKNGVQIIPRDITVPVIAAMSSFGLYNKHHEMAELEAGGTALTAKSGVAGSVVNVMPNGVVYATLSPYLDSAGNSVFGMVAGVALNRIFSGNSNMLRFTDGETDRRLETYINNEIDAAIASKMSQPQKDARLFKIPKEAFTAVMRARIEACEEQLEALG